MAVQSQLPQNLGVRILHSLRDHIKLKLKLNNILQHGNNLHRNENFSHFVFLAIFFAFEI